MGASGRYRFSRSPAGADAAPSSCRPSATQRLEKDREHAALAPCNSARCRSGPWWSTAAQPNWASTAPPAVTLIPQPANLAWLLSTLPRSGLGPEPGPISPCGLLGPAGGSAWFTLLLACAFCPCVQEIPGTCCARGHPGVNLCAALGLKGALESFWRWETLVGPTCLLRAEQGGEALMARGGPVVATPATCGCGPGGSPTSIGFAPATVP